MAHLFFEFTPTIRTLSECQEALSEIHFIDYCVLRMPMKLKSLAIDLTEQKLTWAKLMEKHHLSNGGLAKRRRSIVDLMTAIYLEKWPQFCFDSKTG